MAFYVQLDEDNIVNAVLDLDGTVSDPSLYPIASFDLRFLGLQYTGDGDNSQEVDLEDFGLGSGTPYDPTDPANPNSPLSGGNCLKFPETIVNTGNLNLKGNKMASYNTDSSSFWNYFGSGGTYEYWDATVYCVQDNYDDQTIIELEGTGVLTNVLCPSPKSNNSTVTATVTLDGVEYLFTSRDTDCGRRYCLGFLAPDYDGSGSDAGDNVRIDYPASSWRESDREMFVLIPPTALQRGQSGLKFKESMKIQIRSSSGWSRSGYDEYCGASYLTYIPFGV
jgi:hypothetical protein